MKKLLVLSALLGLLALPVFADHVTIDMGGDMTFGTAGDFDAAQAEKVDLTWDVIVGIDDYNSFTWSLKGLVPDPVLGFTPVQLDKALVTTDIGMWLGLPVGLKVMWGYDDPDANEFGDVSGFGNQAYDFSPAEYWGLGFMLTYNFIEVEAAFDPGVSSNPADLGSILAGVALKEPIPGLNAEVYWFQGGDVATDVLDQGNLGIGAAYATEVAGASLEAGVSFEYEMDSAAAVAWDYGVGLAAGYSMFDVTVGVTGYDGQTLDELSATVDVAAMDMASLFGCVLMSFDDTKDTFQGADLGVNAHVGLVEMYVGYNITSNGAGEYNSDFGLTDGGAYVKFDVDY
jgi:hypothetical protein